MRALTMATVRWFPPPVCNPRDTPVPQQLARGLDRPFDRPFDLLGIGGANELHRRLMLCGIAHILAGRMSIKNKILKASGWTAIGEMGQSGLRFVSNFILARILSPEVFGLMTVVYAVMTGLHMFTEMGLRAAIVQHPRGEDEAFQNTAWTLQVIRGASVFAVTWALGWPASKFFDQPALMMLMPAIGFTSFIEGFVPSRFHLANRNLLFGRVTVLGLVVTVVGLIVRIGVALVWPSVWALVIGAWASSVALVVLSFLSLPGIPNKLRMHLESRKELFRFGRWILISMIMVFLGSQLDRLIFAKMIPLASLGAYNLALIIATMPTDALGKLVSGVGLPALSRIRERDGHIRVAMRHMRLAVLVPAGASSSLLMLIGPILTGVMFDARYKDVGWLTQLLALAAWFRIMESVNANALMAIGLPKLNAVTNLIKVVSMAVLVPLGGVLGGESHRFLGALCGLLLSDLVKYLACTIQAKMHDLDDWGLEIGGTLAVAGCAAGLAFFEWGQGHSWSVAARTASVLGIFVLIWAPITWKAYREVRVLLPGRGPLVPPNAAV